MEKDFGKAKEVQGSFSAFNNVMSGLDLGQKVPESKVTIDISIVVWDIKPGNTKPDISSVIRKDTAVNLKDAASVRWKHSQQNGQRYQEASRNYFKVRR